MDKQALVHTDTHTHIYARVQATNKRGASCVYMFEHVLMYLCMVQCHMQNKNEQCALQYQGMKWDGVSVCFLLIIICSNTEIIWCSWTLSTHMYKMTREQKRLKHRHSQTHTHNELVRWFSTKTCSILFHFPTFACAYVLVSHRYISIRMALEVVKSENTSDDFTLELNFVLFFFINIVFEKETSSKNQLFNTRHDSNDCL